jgi:hypothetical protein
MSKIFMSVPDGPYWRKKEKKEKVDGKPQENWLSEGQGCRQADDQEHGCQIQQGPQGFVMPFKSQKQRAWMYANKPKMAKEWEAETPKGKKLPVKKKPHRGKKGGR